MPKDLFHPSQADEKIKHKLKRLIQSPNSFFMDVKCPGCFHITTIFSHAQVLINRIMRLWQYIIQICFFISMYIIMYIISTQTVVLCAGCSTVLSQPSGGRCRLTEGCSFRKKVDQMHGSRHLILSSAIKSNPTDPY